MRDFNRGSGSRDRRGGGFSRSFGGDRGGFDRGGRGDKQMFKAVCSNCGRDCEVPFRPTGEKPVYCSNCFEKMGDGGRGRSSERPRFGDRRPQEDRYKAQFEALNNKLDRIIDMLHPKPVTEPAPVVELVEEMPLKETKAKASKPKKSTKKKSSEVKE